MYYGYLNCVVRYFTFHNVYLSSFVKMNIGEM